MQRRTTIPPPAWTMTQTEDSYLSKALSGEIVTARMLAEFGECPASYHSIVSGRMRLRHNRAVRFGVAARRLILEGRSDFRGKPDDEPAFSREEIRILWRMREAVRGHAAAADWLRDGWPGLTAAATLEGVVCQARLEWLHQLNVIVDLRTVDDIARFEADAWRCGYLRQLAFSRSTAEEACGKEINVCLAAVEKREPFRVGIWMIPLETLAVFDRENRRLLRECRQCRETGIWPTGYESMRNLALGPKMVIGA